MDRGLRGLWELRGLTSCETPPPRLYIDDARICVSCCWCCCSSSCEWSTPKWANALGKLICESAIWVNSSSCVPVSGNIACRMAREVLLSPDDTSGNGGTPEGGPWRTHNDCLGRNETPSGQSGAVLNVGVPGLEFSCESMTSLGDAVSLDDSLSDSGAPGCPWWVPSGCFGRGETPPGQSGDTLDIGVPAHILGEASSCESLPSLGESLDDGIGNGGTPGGGP